MTAYDRLFIDGEWVSSSGNAVIRVISPHTEEPIAGVPDATPADVDAAVRAARIAFDNGPWPRLDPSERIAVLQRLAERYKQRRAEMAELITAEIGAPVSFSKMAQVRLPLMMMSAFCSLAADYKWQEDRSGFYGHDIRIAKRPVGVVAAIVPWNMPQFLTISKAVPALLAGCCVVVKPAPESPLDALLLAEFVAEAGLPPGVLNVVTGGPEVGDCLVRHPGVDKVSFTGSTAAGRQVARACADQTKPVSLELGGKSAAIVLEDADPTTVAASLIAGSLSNSGQICNALTRILLPTTREAEFLDALREHMRAMTVGDPRDPHTQIGPLVAARQRDRVRDFIEGGLEEGARLVCGGAETPPGLDRGWYVQPTLFADADNTMRIAREEIFGPVLTVISYDNEDDAVRIANDSDYGLAGAVFTPDTDRGYAVAARVHTGSFGINQGYTMDPYAPFGGMKASGYGRELGREGFEGYVHTQSISSAAVPTR
ncbi:aldehyde dehydrogenase [Mycolicibacterium fluoranthenivorans]|uniref:aldehyde dehydrogenase (NAD(+)) n=1 Tax=Mycolicibacterium fluoranthenivorans TaxID=258505 RepID=A0A1G4WYJ1_9MYCO|nr:aldehyde dehydrogenase [Mycolicibacterium fluoranthenivorans]SCX32429.1 Acyl-CoA reductase [Mycolicibacterium fluoranthenivorans]